MSGWSDTGILLKARPYGDTSYIAHFLTMEHGRFAGMVRGGQSAKRDLQPGSIFSLNWMSRLDDQLGFYTFEVEQSVAPRVLDDPLRLQALLATLGLLDRTLAEREPAVGPYNGCRVWIDMLETELWGQTLVHLELGLLGHLGYGLRLDKCAVTGAEDGLAFVSPKSGAAVSEAGAGDFKDKLLPLPPFLTGQAGDDDPSVTEQVVQGLNLTGYFLHHWVFAVTNTSLPADRVKLVEKIAAQGLDE